MISLTVVSHMFPNNMFPENGIFIYNQIKSLKKFYSKELKIRILSPVPYSPKVLTFFSTKWKNYYRINQRWTINSLNIIYPRYVTPPSMIFKKGFSHGLSAVLMKQSLTKFLKNLKSHVIHVHTAIPDCYAVLKLKRFHRLPVICHVRGSDIHTYPYLNKFNYRLVKWALENSDLIISVSEALKKEIFKLGIRKNIQVVYNGVDLTSFRKSDGERQSTRRILNIHKNDRVLLFVGSLIKEKGIDELLTAFKEIKNKHNKVKLLIVGDGPKKRDIENSSDIILAGKIPHSKLPFYYNASDIFVFPTHKEGLPNVVLEALASELPVVTTYVGGIPEVVKSCHNGILIAPMDIKALVNALLYLIENPKIAKDMGRNGRDTVSRKFTWEISAKNLMKIYENFSS